MKALHHQDRKLARRMIRGDEAAFGEFFDSYFPGLFRFARARLGQDQAAEDVAQATLCKAIDKLSTYRGEAALFSWLCTFCRHEIADHCRRLGRTPEPVGLIEDLPEVWASLTSSLDEADPADLALRRELSHWVGVTLDHLPSHYRLVLTLKYLEERSVLEISERLGLGSKAAESLLTRARAAFRDRFLALQAAGAAGSSRGARP